MREARPPEGQIIVKLESGANCDSSNDVVVDPPTLGFDTFADWLRASDEAKFAAVQEYFHSNGYPEYSWDDGTE